MRKELKEFAGLYSADSNGFIWSHRQNKPLKTFINNSGYECLVLNTGKNPKKFLVHRLIAQTFIPNSKNLEQVNHKNGKKLDNRVTNLNWCTSKQNVQHAMKNGLMNNRGENHGAHKLTDDKVKKIKNLLRKGKITNSEIARRFKVSDSTIGHINFGYIWSHID